MDGSARLIFALGAVLVAVGVGLEAWHAHGLRSELEPEAWEAVGRAIRQQELAGVGLVLTGLAAAGGLLPLLASGAYLGAAALFCGSVYLKHLAGMAGATAVAPTGGVLHILAWLLLAALAWRGGPG